MRGTPDGAILTGMLAVTDQNGLKSNVHADVFEVTDGNLLCYKRAEPFEAGADVRLLVACFAPSAWLSVIVTDDE